MGCLSSKPNVPPSTSSPSTAPMPGTEGSPIQGSHQAPAVSRSKPNTATQAPSPPSNGRGGHAPDRAIHNGEQARLPSQAPLPFPADVPPPPHKGDTTPTPKPPKRAVLVTSLPHNEETLVASFKGAAGTTPSPPAQPDIETQNFRPYEHNRRRPAPSSYQSVPINRSMSAQPLSHSGLPPQALPAALPLHNNGTPMSLPSQRVEGTIVSPPAQPNVQTTKSRQYEYDLERRAPSSYRPTPVNRARSAQPLSQLESPAPSSPPMARAMLASGHSPDAKHEGVPQKSTSGTNKVHVANDNGHQRFPSTVRTILSNNIRSRILVVGKRSSGKSSLVNSIFNVNMSTALGNMPRTLKTSDINAGYSPSENRHLIVHEYSSFDSRVVQNMSTVREFVIGRTRANLPASERLHAIWICVPTSDMIDGNLGDGMDEILELNKMVPVIVVATKFDLVVSQVLFDIAGRDNEEARTTAHKRYERSCRSLFPRDTRDVPVETVSTKTKFGDLITKLIATTHKVITADPHNATTALEANFQTAAVPLVWSIAQRVSHDLIIQASIDVGCSRYWRSLGSSQDFTDQVFEDCVDVIHADIVGVWSLRDEDGYLLGRKFKTKMYDLVKDLTEPHIGSPLSSGHSSMLELQASKSGTGWASTSYQNSVENVRCMMGYIVDLTVILYGLFVSGRDVSASEVRRAMDYHVKSDPRRHIHEDIGRFVTKDAFPIYRGKDQCMEKVIDLIRQYCVPQQNT